MKLSFSLLSDYQIAVSPVVFNTVKVKIHAAKVTIYSYRNQINQYHINKTIKSHLTDSILLCNSIYPD